MGVHPSAFGIHTDGDGGVLVPYSFKTSMSVCANVFAYLNTHETDTPKGVDGYTYGGLVRKTCRGQTGRSSASCDRHRALQPQTDARQRRTGKREGNMRRSTCYVSVAPVNKILRVRWAFRESCVAT